MSTSGATPGMRPRKTPSGFRVVQSTSTSPAKVALARRHETLEGAFSDMGDGLVVEDGTDRIVAFHERHLPQISRGMGRLTV